MKSNSSLVSNLYIHESKIVIEIAKVDIRDDSFFKKRQMKIFESEKSAESIAELT